MSAILDSIWANSEAPNEKDPHQLSTLFRTSSTPLSTSIVNFGCSPLSDEGKKKSATLCITRPFHSISFYVALSPVYVFSCVCVHVCRNKNAG